MDEKISRTGDPYRKWLTVMRSDNISGSRANEPGKIQLAFIG
jgi:hypothetical protein